MSKRHCNKRVKLKSPFQIILITKFLLYRDPTITIPKRRFLCPLLSNLKNEKKETETKYYIRKLRGISRAFIPCF